MLVWPERLLAVLAGPAAVMIASRDAHMRPRAARGILVRLGAQPDQVVVYATHALAGHVLPNLRDNGQLAVMLALTISHESFQLKGRALTIEDAPATDERLMNDRLAMYLDDSARMGVPRRLIEQVSYWPALAITMQVDELYAQTPGPGAGERIGA